MKNLRFLVLLCLLPSGALLAQNSPSLIWGSGLNGSTLQQLAIYADTQNGALFEAPKDASGNRLDIAFNWRGPHTLNPLFIRGSDGNVGIGTNNPQAPLHVAGDVKIGARIYLTTANAHTDGSYGVIGLSTGVPGKNVVFYNYDGPAYELMTLNGTTGSAAINSGGLTVSGNVGIGTASPAFKLDVEGGARVRNPSTSLHAYTSYKIQGPNYVSGLEIAFFGNNNITSDLNWSYGGGAGSAAIVNVNAKPLTFGTSNVGRMIIDAVGNVGIGTFSPDAKLTVKGNIHTQGVDIDMSGAVGPDYVFEKDYDLLPLYELETYINQNKHLPEVPSAKEMEANGLDVLEMNLILLKKVEELTLHLIEIKKTVQKQNERITELETSK